MKWIAQAPANIALIKYMGKSNSDSNVPSNASLSYTLNDLLSYVELEAISHDEDFWEPLVVPWGIQFDLNEAQQKKFFDHLNFIKQAMGYEGAFMVRSCNNFPLGCGLASSASSFAALTKCAMTAIAELQDKDTPSAVTMANISRHGSGSSCRSFFDPWALWTEETVGPIELPYPDLIHHVVLVSHDEKDVSSSEAHRRVASSPEFDARLQNAAARLADLTAALKSQNWQQCFQLVWDDFQEMHALFKTAAEPFTYMTEASEDILNDCQRYWKTFNDGPLVTMDAGPNVHLLFRADQAKLAEEMKEKFLNHHDVI